MCKEDVYDYKKLVTSWFLDQKGTPNKENLSDPAQLDQCRRRPEEVGRAEDCPRSTLPRDELCRGVQIVTFSLFKFL